MDILATRESQDVEEIVFSEDGSWTTMRPACASGVSCRSDGPSSPSSVSNGDTACLNRSSSGLKRGSAGSTNVVTCNEVPSLSYF